MPLLRSLSVTRKGIHARCDGMGACSAESDSPDCCINSYAFSMHLVRDWLSVTLGSSDRFNRIHPILRRPPGKDIRSPGAMVQTCTLPRRAATVSRPLTIPRTRNRQSMSGEASLATRNKAFQAIRSRPASSHRGAAQALPTRQALGHGRHQAIRAAIPTAMPGKSRRMPLSSVTRGIPIDLAKATNSQS